MKFNKAQFFISILEFFYSVVTISLHVVTDNYTSLVMPLLICFYFVKRFLHMFIRTRKIKRYFRRWLFELFCSVCEIFRPLSHENYG